MWVAQVGKKPRHESKPGGAQRMGEEGDAGLPDKRVSGG